MRLKPFLYCAGLDDTHFNGLRRHGNLPFVADTEFSGWGNFSIDNAIHTRVMLDLMGEDHRTSEYLAGLPPSYAKKIAGNARRALADLPHAFEVGQDVWVGVLVKQAGTEVTDQLTEWFTGTLSELAPWVDKKTTYEDGRAKAVRIFMSNASEAARVVRERALELGVFDKPEDIS